MTMVNECKPELCIGLDESETTPAMRIEAAGFERFDAVAALTQTQGNLDRALELLVSGWRPEGAAAEAAAAAAAAAAPKCPFGYGGGAAASSKPKGDALDDLSGMFKNWMGGASGG